uniref:Uncharacterized protein n=1 Tax=Klebsiella pneumoniae TaxID=573 RepID=A0A8B0SQ42_KLEPN|nr:hypothetical protein [Klebsiella pneumoniae]
MISGRDTQILTTVCGFNGDIPRSVHCSTRVNMPQSIFFSKALYPLRKISIGC